MRAILSWILAMGLAVTPALAGTEGTAGKESSSNPAANSPSASKPEATASKSTTSSAPAASPKSDAAPAADSTAKPESSSLEYELQQLRDMIQSQTQEIEAQRAALREQQKKLDALQSQMHATPAAVSSSITAASPAPAAIIPSVGNVPVTVATSGTAASPDPQAKPEEPTSIHIKGITLTPGGFFAAETVWRQRGLAADVNTPFSSIPFPGSSQSSVSEFNASARQSRISMLAEGKINSAKLSGYYETDFLSAGVTSNNNQSNSYTMRQRQFWGKADLNNGWSFTGGQMWSLVTETKSGVANRTEAAPLTIDAQYVAGFSWARQYGFRVAKSFNNKFWLAASVEGAQTTFAGHGNANNFLIAAPGTGGGLFNPTANYSFNFSPDFILKAVFEPGWGHYEVFGVASVFRARVFPNATATPPSAAGAFNDSRVGGAIGVNARFPLFAKKLDFGLHFMGGDGTGRYGTVGLADVTVRPDGTLAPIHAAQGLISLEFHPTPKLDIYGYGGGDYAGRTWYRNSAGAAVGYGSPLFNNSGCNTEVLPTNQNTPPSPGSCTGDTRNLIEGTFGFWYRFYKGPKGTLQYGMQYSYAVRNTWSGASSLSPQGNDNMLFTSFRYYIP